MGDINPEDVAARLALKRQAWAKKCPTPEKVTKALAKNDQERAAAREKLNMLMDDYRSACTQRRWRLERVLDDLCLDRQALEDLAAMYGGKLT